jgi:hypothetical protein
MRHEKRLRPSRFGATHGHTGHLWLPTPLPPTLNCGIRGTT